MREQTHDTHKNHNLHHYYTLARGVYSFGCYNTECCHSSGKSWNWWVPFTDELLYPRNPQNKFVTDAGKKPVSYNQAASTEAKNELWGNKQRLSISVHMKRIPSSVFSLLQKNFYLFTQWRKTYTAKHIFFNQYLHYRSKVRFSKCFFFFKYSTYCKNCNIECKITVVLKLF